MDPELFYMPKDVEHGDAAIRYSAADQYWYNIVARGAMYNDNGPRLFFTEIYRSKTLAAESWTPGTGMGAVEAKAAAKAGVALQMPNATADKLIAPRAWHADTFDFLSNLVQFWGQNEDCNASDMDLVEYEGQTFLAWIWGCQEAAEALAIGLSPLPLERFLAGWFTGTT